MTLYVQDVPAKAFHRLVSGAGLTMREVLCSLKLPDWLVSESLSIFYLKTYPACLIMIRGKPFLKSSARFQNYGIMSNGMCLTARISESPNQENGYLLSDFLIADVQEKYFLSETATAKILNKLLEEVKDRECMIQAE